MLAQSCLLKTFIVAIRIQQSQQSLHACWKTCFSIRYQAAENGGLAVALYSVCMWWVCANPLVYMCRDTACGPVLSSLMMACDKPHVISTWIDTAPTGAMQELPVCTQSSVLGVACGLACAVACAEACHLARSTFSVTGNCTARE